MLKVEKLKSRKKILKYKSRIKLLANSMIGLRIL